MIEPQSRCERPGCKNWAEPHSKTCKEHQLQRTKEKDAIRNHWKGNAAARGYDSVWSNLSKAHLRQEPLCRRCMKNGKLTDATLVDHIIAIRVDPSRRLDPSNLQSLCNSCHIEKTKEDMKKFPEYLCPASGIAGRTGERHSRTYFKSP